MECVQALKAGWKINQNDEGIVNCENVKIFLAQRKKRQIIFTGSDVTSY
jgi:hypothetical protein